MSRPCVVHVKNMNLNPKLVYYVGRRKNGFKHFGNPFSHLEHSLASIKVRTLEESVRYFGKWILGKEFTDIEVERRQWILDNLQILLNKQLTCFCANPNLPPNENYYPLCHATLLKILVERKYLSIKFRRQ